MDAAVKLIGIYSQRLAEVSAHTSLEAIGNHEGTTLSNQTQYPLSQKLSQKM